MIKYNKKWGQITTMIIGITLMLVGTFMSTYASEKDNVEDNMKYRQQEIAEAFNNLHTRIKAMNPYDPRKKRVNDERGGEKSFLDEAEKAVDKFKNLNVNSGDYTTDQSPYQPNPRFQELEKNAVEAINKVNQHLIRPDRPGNVPEGDIIKDFIPKVIRILFRFAYLAILIALIVSGIMLITSYGNEEQVTNAKQILYYILIGFAFITLAFALVKAITNIDFF